MRGRGKASPLYVAPPQRTGIAIARGSPDASTAAAVHSPSLQKDSPRALEGSGKMASVGPPMQNLQGRGSKDPFQQYGIASHRASKLSPVVADVPVKSAAEAAPSHSNLSGDPSIAKKPQLLSSHTKKTGKGQASKLHSNSSTSGSVDVADVGTAAVEAPVSTLTDHMHTIVSACMRISSAVVSNADKALALKELDSIIRSSFLAALIPSIPPNVIPSLAISLPSLVFSGSVGIRALALSVCDGLGIQKCPGWNPDVFLLTCFRFLDASDPSNLQFILQCLSFLISKCNSNWIEPNLPPCMSLMLQFVDTLDHPQKLMQVIRFLSATASKYPAMFKSHMKSVLKLLLGWCLDASIGLDASAEICSAITDFGAVLFLDNFAFQF
jgi:hypothetical protein